MLPFAVIKIKPKKSRCEVKKEIYIFILSNLEAGYVRCYQIEIKERLVK